MDTNKVGDLTKGNTALVDHFGKSCTLNNLRPMLPDGYSKELLSRRLQGVRVNESIVLELFKNFKSEDPGKTRRSVTG